MGDSDDPAVAPITWQIDCLRWVTIGVGSTHRVALESTAFIQQWYVSGTLHDACNTKSGGLILRHNG